MTANFDNWVSRQPIDDQHDIVERVGIRQQGGMPELVAEILTRSEWERRKSEKDAKVLELPRDT